MLSALFASGLKENVCISTRSTHTQSKISLYDPSGQYMAHLLALNVLLLPKDLTIIFILLFMMSAYDVNLLFLTSVFGVGISF